MLFVSESDIEMVEYRYENGIAFSELVIRVSLLVIILVVICRINKRIKAYLDFTLCIFIVVSKSVHTILDINEEQRVIGSL